MAILKSCCCWRSVRTGSYAAAVYTMIFYSIVLTAGTFHVKSVLNFPVPAPVLLTFSILMLVCASFTILSSGVLIIGLCLDKRFLLLPWMISISSIILLDVLLSIYLAIGSTADPLFLVMLLTDFFICALNVYCLLCVFSQYQDYRAGRGSSRHMKAKGPLPAIRFEPASSGASRPTNRRELGPNDPRSPKMSPGYLRNGGSSSGSPVHLLVAGSSTGSNGSNYASCGGHFSTVTYLLSRSSISSTSEISFSSSSGSRRGSAFFRDRSDSLAGRTVANQAANAASTFQSSQNDRQRKMSCPSAPDQPTVTISLVDDEVPINLDVQEIDKTALCVPESNIPPVSRFRPSLQSSASEETDTGKLFQMRSSQRRSALVCEEVTTSHQQKDEATTSDSKLPLQ